eukprot:1146208-Pelagomonas_calceolata.AAC.15
MKCPWDELWSQSGVVPFACTPRSSVKAAKAAKGAQSPEVLYKNQMFCKGSKGSRGSLCCRLHAHPKVLQRLQQAQCQHILSKQARVNR